MNLLLGIFDPYFNSKPWLNLLETNWLEISLMEPQWLLILPLLYFLLFLLWRHRMRRNKRLFVGYFNSLSRSLNNSSEKRNFNLTNSIKEREEKGYIRFFPNAVLNLILNALLMSLFVLIMCRPYWGNEPDAQKLLKVDITFLWDVSLSMMVQDVKPSRTELAKLWVKKILTQLPDTRVAINIFSGKPIALMPMTADLFQARRFIEFINPENTPNYGTNLTDAIEFTLKNLLQSDKNTTYTENVLHQILIISDGDITQKGGEDFRYPQNWDARKFQISALIVGTAQGGPIPWTELLIDKIGAGEALSHPFLKATDKFLAPLVEESQGILDTASYSMGEMSRFLHFYKSRKKQLVLGKDIFIEKELHQPLLILCGYLFLLILILEQVPFNLIKATWRGKQLYLPFVAASLLLCKTAYSSWDLSDWYYRYKSEQGLNKKDTNQALKLLSYELTKPVPSEETLYNAIYCYLKLNQFTPAEILYERFKTLYQNKKENNLQLKAAYNLGTAFLQRQNIEQTRKYYQDLFVTNSNSKEILALKDKAQKNLEKILEKNLPPQAPKQSKKEHQTGTETSTSTETSSGMGTSTGTSSGSGSSSGSGKGTSTATNTGTGSGTQSSTSTSTATSTSTGSQSASSTQNDKGSKKGMGPNNLGSDTATNTNSSSGSNSSSSTASSTGTASNPETGSSELESSSKEAKNDSPDQRLPQLNKEEQKLLDAMSEANQKTNQDLMREKFRKAAKPILPSNQPYW